MYSPAPIISSVASFAEPLQVLFEPKRYKVLYGGRGAGRSWGVARALLILGTQRPLRVLCAREFQNSIAESVHKLLSDQIEILGLGHLYEIQQARIIGPNGTYFAFEGIKNNTAKIKSYEGIDICWVEEAVKTSRASWEILIPTIRKEGSEIWMTFNPEAEDDYTYVRFVKEANHSMAHVVKMTWRDNPWFPEELRLEMEDLRERDYDAYLNVWEGFPRRILEGVVYAKELRAAESEGRVCMVPWDRQSPVDTFWDLGFRDQTAVWLAQRVAGQNRILAYVEGQQEDIHYYLKTLGALPYTYGTFNLPHDAKAKRLVSKRSIEEIIRQSGRKTLIAPKLSIADGINACRVIFNNCWFDEKKCAAGLVRLRKYRFKVIEGQFSETPLHDENSNGADAFRTLGVALKAPRQKSTILERLAALAAADAKADRVPHNWLRS